MAAALLLNGCEVAPMGPGLMDNGSASTIGPEAAAALAAAAAASGPKLLAGWTSSAPSLTPMPSHPVAATRPAGATPGLLDVLDRPAERALLAGLRAYDDAQYPEAEVQLKRALDGRLGSPRDRTAAHKQLAFIYCTTARAALCEAEFRAALKDDPTFALSRGEAGHPMWGPVYKRVRSQ